MPQTTPGPAMDLEEKAKNLNIVLKQLRLMGKLSAVFIILCFMAFFQNLSIGIGMFLVLAAYFILFYRRKVRLYQREVKGTIVAEGLRPVLGAVAYRAKDGEARAAVLAADGFLPLERSKGLVVRDTVRADYKQRPLLLTDVSTRYRTVVTNARGKQVPLLDPLSGCYFEWQLPAAVPADFTLWPDAALPDDARAALLAGWREQPLPTAAADGEAMPPLPDGYRLYTRAGQPALAAYPRLWREFAALCAGTPGQVALQARGDMVRIFIKGRFVYAVRLSIFTPMTPALLRSNPVPEAGGMLRVAEAVARMQ